MNLKSHQSEIINQIIKETNDIWDELLMINNFLNSNGTVPEFVEQFNLKWIKPVEKNSEILYYTK